MTHDHIKDATEFCYETDIVCANCGCSLTESDIVHQGYFKNRVPAIVCHRCAPLLDETVARYYRKSASFESPEPQDKLWRYMDIAKFISMLSTESLYFSPSEAFDDPFEGAKGILGNQSEWNEYYLDFFRFAIKTAPGISKEDSSDEKLELTSQRLLKELAQNGLYDRKSTCISCWHCNEYESEAMWKLYSANVTNAVAIETTYQNLHEALGEDPYVKIGRVKYIDFRKRYSKIGFDAFWYKRKSFEHEREVRAIILNHENSGKGISRSVDLDVLIKNVYVSPYAPEWFAEVVRDVVLKYNLKKPVMYSSMRDQPFF